MFVAIGQPTSGQVYSPVIVAVIAMRMMQASFHNVISVVPVRYGFVPAIRAVNMT